MDFFTFGTNNPINMAYKEIDKAFEIIYGRKLENKIPSADPTFQER